MSLRKNIAINYLGQGWVALLGFAFLPLYIKYLGVEAYGLIGVFTALQAWFVLLDMGITPTLNREMARFTAGVHTPQAIRNLLRSLEFIAIAVAVAISVSVLFAADWLARDWLKVEKLPLDLVAQSIAIIGFVIALRFVEGIYRGSLLGLQKQVWFNGANALLASLRQVLILSVLAWVSPTITAFFICQGIVSLLAVVVLACKVYVTLPASPARPRFSKEAVLGIWRFAGGMVGITFLAILLTQIDKVLLSSMLTLEDFGYYTLAGTVASVLYMVITPITQAAYPRMVELLAADDKAGLSSIYHRSAQLVTVITGPAAMLLVFFPQGILYMWSGDADLARQTGPLLCLLGLGTFLNGLMYVPYHLQLTYGQTRLAIITNSVAVAVLVPAMLYLVPIYGAKGAAWIWVLLNLGYIAVVIHFLLRRLMPEGVFRWPVRDVLMPLAAAAGLCALMSILEPGPDSDRAAWFVFLLTAGIGATLAALLSAGDVRASLAATMMRFRKIPGP